MEDARRGWVERIAVGMTIALLFVLAGCDIGASVSRVSHGGQRTPGPTPGGLAPTATAAKVTPIATASVRCKVQALPSGWTWYQDARYSFRLAVPPGWRTGSFDDYGPNGPNSAATSPAHIHIVDFFGPESHGQAKLSGKMRYDTSPPVITIEVDVGSEVRPTHFGSGVLPNWYAQTTPICIGKTPITPYLFTNDEGDVEWAAVLPAGPHGYPYEFSVASDPDTATRDGIYFQTALATFTASP